VALLDVRDLLLHYASPRGAVRAVDHVSFAVPAMSHAVGIIGETGSGKSSLVMALARVLPRNVEAYSGRVDFKGTELISLSNERFRREIRWKEIAVVFQGAMNGFNPVLRVGRQLDERLRAESASPSAARAKVEELIGSVGLSKAVYERYPHELSGGMKQRAAIAMALTMDPAVIILDEPTSALDVSVQAQIMNLLKRLKWDLGLSMLFVTHDIALASDLSDSVAVMYAGEIREIGSAEAVLSSPRDPYTQELLASIPRLRGRGEPRFVTGTPPDPAQPPAGCRFRPRCPRAFAKCTEAPPLFPVDAAGAHGDDRHLARCWLAEGAAAEEARP